jgi:L-fucose mutarotase
MLDPSHEGDRMLKTRLLHPGILEALGGAGHGSKVLIADGNFSLATNTNPAAHRVFLNLAPGKLTVTDILEVLLDAIPIEAIQVMAADSGEEPPIYEEVRQLVPGVPLQPLGRFDFYDAARSPDVALAIATGEQRLYANVLITIGVVMPD